MDMKNGKIFAGKDEGQRNLCEKADSLDCGRIATHPYKRVTIIIAIDTML